MRPVAIIQARTGSTRLPGKVLKPLADHTVLWYVIQRCRQAQRIAEVMIATTDKPDDDPIVEIAAQQGIAVFRGSEQDVLGRYIGAARQCAADPILRITSDCPLIDPEIIDAVVEEHVRAGADYACIAGYPRGVGDAETMTLSALETAYRETTPADTGYREHVMTYLTDHPEKFRVTIGNAPSWARGAPWRLCVDEVADLKIVQRICEHFAPRVHFSLSEILTFLRAHPELAALNRHVKQKTV
jgi:spore coat polysaccharide biosynthesis protein SpsF